MYHQEDFLGLGLSSFITPEKYEDKWRGAEGRAHRSDCLSHTDDFMCDGWKVVSCEYWCNNIVDCGDGGDEMFCDGQVYLSKDQAITFAIDNIKHLLNLIEKLIKRPQ